MAKWAECQSPILIWMISLSISHPAWCLHSEEGGMQRHLYWLRNWIHKNADLNNEAPHLDPFLFSLVIILIRDTSLIINLYWGTVQIRSSCRGRCSAFLLLKRNPVTVALPDSSNNWLMSLYWSCTSNVCTLSYWCVVLCDRVVRVSDVLLSQTLNPKVDASIPHAVTSVNLNFHRCA